MTDTRSPGGEKTYALADLLTVMARLRDPETGCPWDVKQSFETIAPYTIEEAYEVADAIQRGDTDALKEELGDLLLQVVYHAQLANEMGSFSFDDVADVITRKMIRRHPHVFEDPTRRDAFLGSGLWEQIKAEEKAERGEATNPASILSDVPVGMPGLTRAAKLQKRAADVGFDWSDVGLIISKVEEELAELKDAIAKGEAQERIADEFGDVAFVLANVARHLHVDPEAALRGTCAKFIRRFQYIEAALAAQGRKPQDADLEEMDRLWDAAKRDEKAAKQDATGGNDA
ncbi:nucleoside triphosphate hydrolase [Methyloceanibacter methanicus]|uniref:Nucleoside triphosphate pyrophosphohydrolase n=1 Tax=Methyloceanibacter methanicus TaxID=1774968 RepID=A0A1E3W5D7_9HYPH|nr:nucleoside triphosphate pyrophosphohydrolase [Methyloceanibacter methanicus]ODS00986.1 nucleoside triphosphate hydrolase [Methyloceanibacter methanicus]